MVGYDHLIIGGGIAGTTAAETIRGRDASASIAIIAGESHALYSRVLLPHVVRGQTTEVKAFLRSKEWYEGKNILLMTGRAVRRIDADSRTAYLDDGSGLGYGTLLVATGGTPRKLSCPGSDDRSVLSFQTIEDARMLAAASSGRAVVVGAGFIAVEFMMSFVHHGVPVTAVLRGDGMFARSLDAVSAGRVAAEIERNGVKLMRGAAVSGIERSGEELKVFLSGSNGELKCEAVGAGIGLEPNIRFLDGSGVATDRGVIVDASLHASKAGVFVAGDVAEYEDVVSGGRRMVGNWTNALLQGKTAGANMAGAAEQYRAVTSYTITCFSLPLTFMGATDVMPEVRVVREGDSIVQFLLRGGKVIGATCVGTFSERGAVMQLIERGVHIDERAAKVLADSRLPLQSLLG